MTAATRSSRKKKVKKREEKGSDSDNESSSSSVVEQEQQQHGAAPPTNEASTLRKQSRELRRKRREEIKSKTTGVGLSISTRASGSNKIVFGDNNNSDDENKVDESDAKHSDGGDSSEDSDDSDDDDAVEEVKSSVARDKAMEQLARERDSSKVQKLQSRTKKRKTRTVDDQEEDEFDDDFFAQLDSEMAEQRKQKKIDKQSTPNAGRHTTFLSTEEEVDSQPIEADHNIELVVLGDGGIETNQASITMDKAGIEPSEMSHLFARGRLEGGKEQAKKKGTKKKKQTDAGWKRSKKMNSLAFGQAKVMRRKGRGKAAVNFVIKQVR